MQNLVFMATILIIDDHPLVSDGIRTMLQDVGEYVISGNCKNADEALEFLTKSTPDVILLDISLPDMDGLQLCAEIRKTNRETKILGLTSTNEVGIIIGFMKSGGNGYLLKNMERTELLEALRMVLDGRKYMSKAASEKITESFHSMATNVSDIPALTRREKEIIELLDQGFTGPQIADKLFLSSFTVETHRKNLMKKLHVSNVQMLLKMAREMKIIK